MTLKVHCPVLPALSVAEQVTVLLPRAKTEPDAGEQLTAPTPEQLSEACRSGKVHYQRCN